MELRTLDFDDFPPGLREIPDPPQKLWVAGTLPPVEHTLLAVVGSRALSSYGREACEKLISGLAGYPISIVSGLAFGADACAHRAALKAGLHAIAFPGSGLDERVIAPQTNLGLAKDILKAGGALLSEYEPMTIGAPWTFPERNRLMAGISNAILAIEAGEKSGTLITMRLASEYNRDLLCVPHRIGDPHGFGAHRFIRLGAALVSEPEHILEALGIEPRQKDTDTVSTTLAGNEKLVYELLEEPIARDDLIRQSRLSTGDALTTLVTLELKGLLKEEFGAWRRC